VMAPPLQLAATQRSATRSTPRSSSLTACGASTPRGSTREVLLSVGLGVDARRCIWRP
jgi:hypothetical protein